MVSEQVLTVTKGKRLLLVQTMDTALRQWFPNPNRNANSHTPRQQLQTHIPQRIEDLNFSPLIVDQPMIDQGPQSIHNGIDAIRIGSIE